MHIFFYNDTATTEIYTLSLHDALPILRTGRPKTPLILTTEERRELQSLAHRSPLRYWSAARASYWLAPSGAIRSEEHTSELQSQSNLVCRLLLEKKNDHY